MFIETKMLFLYLAVSLINIFFFDCSASYSFQSQEKIFTLDAVNKSNPTNDHKWSLDVHLIEHRITGKPGCLTDQQQDSETRLMLCLRSE